jgi:riboflavin transporter FmnP
MITDEGTSKLTGTAVLAALVVVFDYTMKFSGFKIPFPWLPFLKFDFTGVPILFALLLYGLDTGITTSTVAFLAILVRSGDPVGASMKAVAELANISGIHTGLRLFNFHTQITSALLGLLLRITVMSIFNLIILPTYYSMPFQLAINLLPLIGVFNAIQGGITTGLGFLLHKAYRRRIPTSQPTQQ